MMAAASRCGGDERELGGDVVGRQGDRRDARQRRQRDGDLEEAAARERRCGG